MQAAISSQYSAKQLMPDAVAINPDKPIATLTPTADAAAAELNPAKAG